MKVQSADSLLFGARQIETTFKMMTDEFICGQELFVKCMFWVGPSLLELFFPPVLMKSGVKSGSVHLKMLMKTRAPSGHAPLIAGFI